MLLTEQLNDLSAAQVQKLEDARNHWRNVGLNVLAIDERKAFAGMKSAYGAAGLKPPEVVIWLKSPRAGATAARLLRSDLEWPASLDPTQRAVWDDVWKQALRQVERHMGVDKWAEVRKTLKRQAEVKLIEKNGIYIEKQVKEYFGELMGIWIWRYLKQIAGASKFEQIRTDVEEQVRAAVEPQVSHAVREEAFQELVAPIRQQVWSTIGEPLRQMIMTNNGVLAGRQTWDCGFGQLDSSWVGYYDFLRTLGVKGIEPLDGIKKLTESSGWWWAYENVCMITGRPQEIHRDNRGHLHNETGMAIRYSDGWGFYAWHGIIVPEYVILLPDEITFDMINEEPNAEVRRVLIERYGLDQYLKSGNVIKIHQDPCGILYRMNIKGDEPIMVVRVVNSTPEPDGIYKEYFLRVPPNVLRARQAVAWTFGLTEEEYFPLAET